MSRGELFLLSLSLLACGESPEVLVGRNRAEQSDDASAPSIEPPTTAATEQSSEAGAAEDPLTGRDDAGSEPAPSPCDAPDPLLDYVFTGSGNVVREENGGPSAQLLGGASLRSAAAGGGVALDGDDDFIQLPAGLLQNLGSVTLSVWFRIDGGPAYVRILDFGMGSTEPATEGDGSVGRSYLALTPGTGLDLPRLAALASSDGAGDEVAVSTNLEVRDDVLHQATIVVDGEQSELRLYLDGENAGVATLPFALTAIDDRNNWLGRSQYDADPYLEAEFFRFRMFGNALSDCQAQSQWQAGL